jgi:hypothetical protein
VGFLVVAAFAYGVREMRRVPASSAAPSGPITDLAGSPPYTVQFHNDESPEQRLNAQQAASGAPAAGPVIVVMPSQMPDPAHPPQWTAPRADPPIPKPPDPFVPPPVTVDPSPGHHTNAE